MVGRKNKICTLSLKRNAPWIPWHPPWPRDKFKWPQLGHIWSQEFEIEMHYKVHLSTLFPKRKCRGVSGKKKYVGGGRQFFSILPPLRISNGIACSNFLLHSLAKQEDNVLGSVRPSVCQSIHLSQPVSYLETRNPTILDGYLAIWTGFVAYFVKSFGEVQDSHVCLFVSINAMS